MTVRVQMQYFLPCKLCILQSIYNLKWLLYAPIFLVITVSIKTVAPMQNDISESSESFGEKEIVTMRYYNEFFLEKAHLLFILGYFFRIRYWHSYYWSFNTIGSLYNSAASCYGQLRIGLKKNLDYLS